MPRVLHGPKAVQSSISYILDGVLHARPESCAVIYLIYYAAICFIHPLETTALHVLQCLQKSTINSSAAAQEIFSADTLWIQLLHRDTVMCCSPLNYDNLAKVQ